MLLEIDDWRTVGDLQYRFNKCFAGLHLQVFAFGSRGAGRTSLPPGCSLEHIRRLHSTGVLSIKSWFTCKEVEQLLLAKFGVHARVVRLEAGAEIWLPFYAERSLQNLNELVTTGHKHAMTAGNEEELMDWW